MARTETIQVLQFAELSDAAKVKARDWYRSTNDGCCDWSEFVIDDAKAIAALMGIEIDNVGFSGFWSQGDGAHFTGTFGYAKGCTKAVAEYAPLAGGLHAIARDWQALQAANFYKLNGTVSHSGRYQHAFSTDFDVYHGEAYASDDTTNAVKEVLRSLMNWIYCQLEDEYNCINADEAVDENITANEYEFTEDGTRH